MLFADVGCHSGEFGIVCNSSSQSHNGTPVGNARIDLGDSVRKIEKLDSNHFDSCYVEQQGVFGVFTGIGHIYRL